MPTGLDPDACHAGYVFRDGKYCGWKSFFPSGWTQEQLVAHLSVAAGQGLTSEPVVRAPHLFRVVLGGQAQDAPAIILIYDAHRKVIRTFFPDLAALPYAPNAGMALRYPHQLRTPDAESPGVDSELLLEIRRLLGSYDVDGLDEYRVTNRPEVVAALKRILKR